MTHDSQAILFAIAQVIYDKKWMNILALDVNGISSIADYVIIAEGNVDRHVAAIGRSIIDDLNTRNIAVFHTEGLKSGDWVVLDYSGIMVHLFMPGLREKYCLERLWRDSKIVDLAIDVSKPAIGVNNS